MSDKRIKSFLEDRLKMLESIKNEREFTTAELGDIACCKQTLAFIDSLQEEPVKQSVDEAMAEIERKVKLFTEANKSKTSEEILSEMRGKEPVSDDLNEAARQITPKVLSGEATNFYNDDDVVLSDEEECFKAGAQWQKEQFEKNRLKHCNSITNEQAELEQGFIDQHLNKYQRMPTFLDAIEYGMRLQQEQMMAKAVDGEIGYWNIRGLSVNMDLPRTLEEGDKVRLIIIKED